MMMMVEHGIVKIMAVFHHNSPFLVFDTGKVFMPICVCLAFVDRFNCGEQIDKQ